MQENDNANRSQEAAPAASSPEKTTQSSPTRGEGDTSSRQGGEGDTSGRQGPGRSYSQRGEGEYNREGRGSDDRNQRGSYRPRTKLPFRRKFCFFTRNHITYIDYKDTLLLKRFLGRNGQILSPRITSVKPFYQRKLAFAIKRARYMALIPYVGEVVREEFRPYTDRENEPSEGDAKQNIETPQHVATPTSKHSEQENPITPDKQAEDKQAESTP